MRAAPGWWAREQRDGGVGLRGGHDGAEAAAHVEDLPHLGVGHLPERLDEPEDGRHRQRVVDLEADVGVQAQQVQHPAAGDVREPAHVELRAQQLEHGADVDHGRLEQRVGDARAAQLRGRASSESEPSAARASE